MQIHELNTLIPKPGNTDYLAIDTGFDTAKISASKLLEPKINRPIDENNQYDNGQKGQLLRSKGDGSTEWADVGQPTDAQTAQAVSDWLDAHPEATTTVQDGSVTDEKLVQHGGVLDKVKALGQSKIFADLYQNRYVGHKGFNGWINDSTSKAVVQSNSLMALDLAKKLGVKFVETDTTVLSDGTWVISHEINTSDMDGTLKDLIDIDLAEFKSRKVIREYLTGGTYWTYSADEQYTPVALEEFLLRAKELGLYVLPEVKWIDSGYTSQNWDDFANVVKNCGMENSIAIYTAYTAYMRSMYQRLPNTPVCNMQLSDSNVDSILAELSNYPYAFACTGYSSYGTILQKCIAANVPLGLWVVDDYDKAKKFIADGGTFIVTDCLTETVDATEYFLQNEFGIDEFYKRSKKYIDSGSQSYNDYVLTITSGTYATVYLQNLPVKPQDVIEVSVKIKSDGISEGQIIISDTLSAPQRRRIVSSSTSTEWQTLTAVFLAGQGDSLSNVSLGNRNLIGGSSTVLFKDLVIKHYTINDPSVWIESDDIFYKTDGKTVTIMRGNNIELAAYTWTKVGSLPFPYIPLKEHIVPITLGSAGNVLGFLKADVYGDIKIYCPSAQTVQYYTVTFNI